MDPEKQIQEMKIKVLHIRVQALEQMNLEMFKLRVNLIKADMEWKTGMVMLLKSLPLGLPTEILSSLESLQTDHEKMWQQTEEQMKTALAKLDLQLDQNHALNLQIFEDNSGQVEGLE